MYLECLERHHCPFELTRCFYFARYLDGIEKLHLTDTVIEFMGGLNNFVPREIDRQLQLGTLIDNPEALQAARRVVWSHIREKLTERLKALPELRHDTVDQVMALTPSEFDAYLQLLVRMQAE